MGEVVTSKFVGLQVERIQINQLFDDVIEDYKLNGRSSLVETESRLKSHLRPFFGDIRAAAFSTADVKRYVNMRLETGELVKKAFS